MQKTILWSSDTDAPANVLKKKINNQSLVPEISFLDLR